MKDERFRANGLLEGRRFPVQRNRPRNRRPGLFAGKLGQRWGPEASYT